MIHSLRLRLLLTMVAVVAVTAGSVALIARQTTVLEFQRYLALNDERSQRIGQLFGAAGELRAGTAEERAVVVRRLAASLGQRVLLVDEADRIVADSAGAQVGQPLMSVATAELVVLRFAAPPPSLPGDQLVVAPFAAAAPLPHEQLISNTIEIEAAPGALPVDVQTLSGSNNLFFQVAPLSTTVAPGQPMAYGVSGAPVMIAWDGPAMPDPIQAGFIAGVNRSLAFALVVAGLAAALLTWAVSRRIIGPIEELTAAARRLAAGDLAQRVPVRARDEIAQLAQAFNAMAGGLEQVERLRRHMVTDVAHELRTPLTNIRGYLEALRDGVAAPAPAMLDSLHEEALLLNRLIDDLQDLALAEAGQLRLCRQPTELAGLVAQVISAARPRLAARGVVCTAALPADLPLLDADPERVGQVLRNLLNNALTHTPPGGRISIAATPAGALVTVTVADTGSGIPPAELPFVFERFYRADRSRNRATGGAGLGLTIVRRLVEAHGGRAWAESAPGSGTSVRFTLPAWADQPPAA